MTDVAPAVLVQPYTRLVLENNENVGHGEKGALGDVAEVVLDAEDVSCLGCTKFEGVRTCTGPK